jgi:ABC-type sulfate transport system permease component
MAPEPWSRWRRAWLAWALWALAIVGLVVTVWLDQLLRQTGRPELVVLIPTAIPPVLGAVSTATVGALVASRRPRHPVGQLLGRDSSLAVAGATLAVAAVFQPARRRIQTVVDRRFNRRRYDAARTVEAFSARLRDQIELDTLSAELLAGVEQTLEPTTGWPILPEPGLVGRSVPAPPRPGKPGARRHRTGAAPVVP